MDRCRQPTGGRGNAGARRGLGERSVGPDRGMLCLGAQSRSVGYTIRREPPFIKGETRHCLEKRWERKPQKQTANRARIRSAIASFFLRRQRRCSALAARRQALKP